MVCGLGSWLASRRDARSVPARPPQAASYNANMVTATVVTQLSTVGQPANWHDTEEDAFSGDIPASIGQMENLQEIYLHANRFVGPIPHTIGQLRKLTKLLLHKNYLTGTIPATISNLAHLAALTASNNALSGRPHLQKCSPRHANHP